MLITEILFESRGIMFRTPGDIWKNDIGVEISLVNIIKYPSAGVATEDDLNSEFSDLEQKLLDQDDIESIKPVNDFKSIHKAYAVAIFNITNIGTVKSKQYKINKKIAFVKWLTKIDPSSTGQWSNNDLDGFKYQGSKSIKSLSGLKPSNLLKTDHEYSNPKQILADIKNKATESLSPEVMLGLTNMINKPASDILFPVQKDLETMVRDDLGEIISPIALWQGRISEAEQTRKTLLGNAKWNSCKISFPAAKNAGLLDSVITTADGVRIGISSKGGAGAKASISNIVDGLEVLKSKHSPILKTVGGKKLLHITEVLSTNTAKIAPMLLALEMDIISKEQFSVFGEAMHMTEFAKDKKAEKLSDYLTANTANRNKKKADPIFDQLNNGPIELANQIQTSKIYMADTKNAGYRIGFHVLSIVAKLVAKKINEDPQIGKAALAVLNNSPFVQIHLHTKYQQDEKVQGIAVQKWEVIFPLEFSGTVKMSADKSYWASGVGGHMTFGFD
jgi:hypothetical protein